MVSYNNSNVVQCLRQYDMFANSLNLVKTREEKDMIIKQLTKLEKKIIELTNDIYEDEYNTLANKECGLIEEEQTRLNMLIDLINQRLSYVEKRCNNHYQLTGNSIDVNDVLGASVLDSFEERLLIIGKYSKNIELEKELKKEVESLTNKITLAYEKIEINESLNIELEKTLCDILSSGFEKCHYYDLVDDRDAIEYIYYETEKSLTLAELNLETAKTSPLNILNDCQQMFDDIKNDYIKYKEKLNILKLMDIFNKEVTNYDELLLKRKEINELFRCIKNDEFLGIVMDSVTKQYNTILMEQQDLNTYNDLMVEKERKLEALAEINEENNSEKFQEVLKELIRNEEARQARILEEQRKLEEEEKKRKLELERKKQEEILKRQKIIEEARKKEMEKRTKELLEQQQKSFLQNKKRDSGYSFGMMKKDHSKKKENDLEQKKQEDIKVKKNNDFKEEKEIVEEKKVTVKDKADIEKELFEEFNNGPTYELNLDVSSDSESKDEYRDNFFDDMTLDNKLPDVSIDEYMKNFSEDQFEDNDVNLMFSDDDLFPNIPF